jgi:hypothetical protein
LNHSEKNYSESRWQGTPDRDYLKNIAGMVAAGNSRNKKRHQIRLSFASHAAYFPYRHEAGFVLAQLHNSRSATNLLQGI